MHRTKPATSSILTLLTVASLPLVSPNAQADELNRFWRHIHRTQSGLYDGDVHNPSSSDIDLYNEMEECIQRSIDRNGLNQQSSPEVADTLLDSINRTVLVEIKQAIPPQQAHALEQLAKCTREIFPITRSKHRNFHEAGGGNDVTYLQVLLQHFLPEVYETVLQITDLAYHTAQWSTIHMPLPRKCGLRTSEHLNYDSFKTLGGHADSGSVYTTVFSLSDSRKYKGGEFYVGTLPYESILIDEGESVDPNATIPFYDELYYYKPRQYSAVVFWSFLYHGVTGVNGTRETFANELWMHSDAPWFKTRPMNAEMELFLKRLGGRVVETEGDVDEVAKLWPLKNEVKDYDYFYDYGVDRWLEAFDVEDERNEL
ncbi:hypothetical protein ACHAXN_006003 [Cyclotella atomus]